MSKFPKGFLWGGATAANQFEGACRKAAKVCRYSISRPAVPSTLAADGPRCWNPTPFTPTMTALILSPLQGRYRAVRGNGIQYLPYVHRLEPYLPPRR